MSPIYAYTNTGVINMHMHIYIHTHTHTHIHIYIYIYIYICICVCVCVCIYICMCMFITPVFVYAYMGLIFECIYLGIVFTNKHVFCFDHTIMNIQKKKKKFGKKKKECFFLHLHLTFQFFLQLQFISSRYASNSLGRSLHKGTKLFPDFSQASSQDLSSGVVSEGHWTILSFGGKIKVYVSGGS